MESSADIDIPSSVFVGTLVRKRTRSIYARNLGIPPCPRAARDVSRDKVSMVTKDTVQILMCTCTRTYECVASYGRLVYGQTVGIA